MQAIKKHMDLTTTNEYTKPIWTSGTKLKESKTNDRSIIGLYQGLQEDSSSGKSGKSSSKRV